MVYVICGAVVFVMLLVYKGSGSFFRAVLSSALGGVGALCAVNTLSYFLPLSICFNWFTIAFSSLFSVPGVVLLLLSDVFLF